MGSVIRYSEAFKLQVLRELEEGKFSSKEAAKCAYGIGGSETISGWIRKYGKKHLQNKVVRVEKPDETSELKRLRKRVRDLEKGLADAHLDLKFEEAYTRIACRRAGIADVAEFKKKNVGKL